MEKETIRSRIERKINDTTSHTASCTHCYCHSQSRYRATNSFRFGVMLGHPQGYRRLPRRCRSKFGIFIWLKVAPLTQCFCFCNIQAANIVSRYRGGAAESSLDSLDSSSNESQSQSSSGTRGSIENGVNGTETLPCGNREVSTTVTQSNQEQTPGFHWTLSNLQTARRNNTGTVRVDLASPEDISLDTDSSRVVFSAYGTTV